MAFQLLVATIQLQARSVHLSLRSIAFQQPHSHFHTLPFSAQFLSIDTKLSLSIKPGLCTRLTIMAVAAATRGVRGTTGLEVLFLESAMVS
jgi:hypothetical protein